MKTNQTNKLTALLRGTVATSLCDVGHRQPSAGDAAAPANHVHRRPASQRPTTAALAALLALTAASHAISIDTVTVGDAGNAADSTGYGAVSYTYNIGKYEVTLLQYTAFLNAVAATDTYSLYNTGMATNLNIAGISRAGSSGSYTYSLIGDGNRPVTYVSWFDAARFSNWMHNGQPTGAQGAGTTEQGAYTLNGATSGVGFTKNVGAQWWIPSEDEWYKAAYYQPFAQGGDTDGYWLYPTQGNTQPNSRNGSASDANSANYYYNDGIANGYNGGYAVTNSPSYSGSQNYLTAAGAFTQADSYYGTFDQGGNVREWNDAVISDSWRGLRGGSWGDGYPDLWASGRVGNVPSSELNIVGFRVATVPEPTTGILLTLGAAALAMRRCRSAK